MRELNIHTKIHTNRTEEPVRRAISAFYRDLEKACGPTREEGEGIFLLEGNQQQECYKICWGDRGLEIHASDTLGFVYGIYRVSEEILGIAPFWFWMDQAVEERSGYQLPEDYQALSGPFRVKYRGWFINDEVLLHTWSVNRRKEEPWEMAFEALLRCGGNMVIPGTDKNSARYHDMALSMGLMVTHHHAEPLGAEMFARVYPDLNPSYEEHGEKFRGLWADAVRKQKGQRIIYNLGFRGQGDVPFWENDPRYETDEARGELMSRLIRRQYDLVKEQEPDAACCTNLYGETMELYQKGCLEFPEDVIKIWADNGYGKMVTRRQENHNPRICALPGKEDAGPHGIYYHVSFYDLQAASHMTMLPNPPDLVVRELTEALEHGADAYWLVNCSNVKPHVYYLDLLSLLWRDGTVDIEAQRQDYILRYYGEGLIRHHNPIEQCLVDYHKYAVSYGPNEDDRAGEQFANHVARMLVCQYMEDSGKPSEHLQWATDADTLSGQVGWYRRICQEAKKGYGEYLRECEKALAELMGHARQLFEDSILLQTQIHYHCFSGAYAACAAMESAAREDYQKAFFQAGKARKEYLKADGAMREKEHGKWKGFYANECLADMKQSAWVMEGFMAYLRCLGDGPHYYQWQREFLYAQEDRRVMLVMNMENHLRDDELFALMEEAWE